MILQVVLTGKAMHVRDASDSSKTAGSTRSVLAVPVHYEGKVVAVALALNKVDARCPQFTDDVCCSCSATPKLIRTARVIHLPSNPHDP